MKTLAHVIMGAFALLVTSQVYAVDAKAAESLAQRNGCLACHTVNEKVVGPALKDVAAKYRGEKGAEAKLIGRVKSGSNGVWGPVPMWPNSPQVKDDDIRVIVQWILTL